MPPLGATQCGIEVSLAASADAGNCNRLTGVSRAEQIETEEVSCVQLGRHDGSVEFDVWEGGNPYKYINEKPPGKEEAACPRNVLPRRVNGIGSAHFESALPKPSAHGPGPRAGWNSARELNSSKLLQRSADALVFPSHFSNSRTLRPRTSRLLDRMLHPHECRSDRWSLLRSSVASLRVAITPKFLPKPLFSDCSSHSTHSLGSVTAMEVDCLLSVTTCSVHSLLP